MERNLLYRELDYLLDERSGVDRFLPTQAVLSSSTNWNPFGSGGVVAFPSGTTLSITTGDTSVNGKHYDPLNSNMPLLDTSGTNYDKYVSRSFQVKEFLKFGSTTKYEAKYGSKPDNSVIRLDPMLVHVLQLLRDHVGKPVKITSGYRHNWYNAILNGAADKSQHLIGRAADITISGMTPLAVAKAAIDAAGAYIFGIGVYSGFTHLDVRLGNFVTWQNYQQQVKDHRSSKNLPVKNTRSFSTATSANTTNSQAPDSRQLLETQFAGGERDENNLTNAVFYSRYPAMTGQKLKSGDPLTKEWITIRDTIVRPFLRSKQSTVTTPGNAAGGIPALGKLLIDKSVPALSKSISSYQFTADDALWVARFAKGEAGGTNTRENHAVIWAMFNRYGAFRHKVPGWGSFGKFIQQYSTTLQPILKNVQAAKRVYANNQKDPKNYPIVKGQGYYPGTTIQKVQYLKHIKLQQQPWNQFSTEIQNLVVNILTGKIPNPGIGIASEFASTRMYYKQKHGYFPNEAQWTEYTKNHSKDKWTWVGPVAGIDQMKNAFFIDNRLKNVPLNSIRVT